MVALLNDLFGIQSRGGCSCAGPYGHRLLGIDIETSHEFEREITRGCEGIKPGWVRVNFNYFITETVFEYILDAVELIAREGWRLLPHYRFDPATGLWHHVGRQAEAPLSLRDINYTADGMRYEAASSPGAGEPLRRLPRRGPGAHGRSPPSRQHRRRRRRPRRRRRLRGPALVPAPRRGRCGAGGATR